jgi:hypothetical protein
MSQTEEITTVTAPWGALKAECFAEEHRPAFRKALRRVRGPRQVGGDDGYFYALWLDDRRVASGMTRDQATYTKNRLILDLMNGRR